MAWSLQEAGYRLAGWEGVLQGDVPVGAGLSSSAALEMATARAFHAAGPWDWQPAVMAKLGQRAENRWVGVNCGIMDQLISAAGRQGCALLIDCRSLQTQPVPFPPGTAVVILDTATRRGLSDSAYNERRAQCEADRPVLRRRGPSRRGLGAPERPGRRAGRIDPAPRPTRRQREPTDGRGRSRRCAAATLATWAC